MMQSMLAKTITFLTLAAFTLSYVVVWITSLWRMPSVGASPASRPSIPSPLQVVTGFVTNFFDTLGIGSFATTTSVFKFARMVPDELIPGTLNIGHTLPTICQAFI